MSTEHDKDCCSLCGGTGEVSITPYGQPDEAMDVFGCPACIQADRDEAERERDQLRQQVEKERAILFAENQRKQQLEQQCGHLMAALELMLERIQEPPDANCSCHLSPPCNDCVDYGGEREAFEFAKDAIAAVKGGAQ